ncbi:transposase, partial [Paenibacillus sp. NEAU-GSW1]|uniref:transposase n=1 Tax=Paenibacillus sp. NEAU-GSW1 TaxID=2682486 RepID=UPI0020A6CF2C
MEYLRLKRQAREQLKSEDGYALSVRRMHEPERVFGQIKNNRGFRRFLLRGLPKVSLEVGWLSLAHHLLKKAAKDKKSKNSVAGPQRYFYEIHFCNLLMRAISLASEPLLRRPLSFF